MNFNETSEKSFFFTIAIILRLMNIYLLASCACSCLCLLVRLQCYCQRLMDISGCFMFDLMRGEVQTCIEEEKFTLHHEFHASFHLLRSFTIGSKKSQIFHAEVNHKKCTFGSSFETRTLMNSKAARTLRRAQRTTRKKKKENVH